MTRINGGYFFSAECERCGTHCQARRDLLCRPQSRGRQRAGGRAPGADRPERYRLEQIRTLDKRRLRERMGKVDGTVMEQVDTAIAVSFGLSRSRLV